MGVFSSGIVPKESASSPLAACSLYAAMVATKASGSTSIFRAQPRRLRRAADARQARRAPAVHRRARRRPARDRQLAVDRQHQRRHKLQALSANPPAPDSRTQTRETAVSDPGGRISAARPVWGGRLPFFCSFLLFFPFLRRHSLCTLARFCMTALQGTVLSLKKVPQFLCKATVFGHFPC